MEYDHPIGTLSQVSKYEDLCAITRSYVNNQGVSKELKEVVEQLIMPKQGEGQLSLTQLKDVMTKVQFQQLTE